MSFPRQKTSEKGRLIVKYSILKTCPDSKLSHFHHTLFFLDYSILLVNWPKKNSPSFLYEEEYISPKIEIRPGILQFCRHGQGSWLCHFCHTVDSCHFHSHGERPNKPFFQRFLSDHPKVFIAWTIQQ